MTADQLQHRLQQWRRGLLGLAVLAIIVCAAGAWRRPEQFYVSYLFGFVFWIGLSLGCAAMVMIHCLVGGAWGRGLRRIMEAGAWPLLFMMLFCVPLLFGLQQLYEWTDPHVQEHLGTKVRYLNLPFFLARGAVYFVIWALLIFLLVHWSVRQDRSDGARFAVRLQRLAAPGLILYVLTMTFAAFDWLMSLDPHWFSSIFGVIVIVGQGLAGLAFSILCLSCLSTPSQGGLQVQHAPLIDVGNLLMAGVVLWAYVSFSQFLIIWSGDLVEEIPWYLHRSRGGWQYVAGALALFHFFVPFFLLLMRDVKQNRKLLGAVAAMVLVMHVVDSYWLIMPGYHREYVGIHWLDVAVFVALGSVWTVLFLIRLPQRLIAPHSELVAH